MSRDEVVMWLVIGGLMLVIAIAIIGLAMLGSYIAYGDVGCAFAHCIRVVP